MYINEIWQGYSRAVSDVQYQISLLWNVYITNVRDFITKSDETYVWPYHTQSASYFLFILRKISDTDTRFNTSLLVFFLAYCSSLQEVVNIGPHFGITIYKWFQLFPGSCPHFSNYSASRFLRGVENIFTEISDSTYFEGLISIFNRFINKFLITLLWG